MSRNGAPGAQDAAQKSSSTAGPPLPPPHHPDPQAHHPGETRIPPEPSAQDAPTSSSPSSSSSAGRVARTWVRFAKAFVLIFPVYALGYFEFSVSWLLIGLAIFFFWRRNACGKSSRLSRALACLQQQEMEMEMKEEEEKRSRAARALDTTELPSWVRPNSLSLLPESEHEHRAWGRGL